MSSVPGPVQHAFALEPVKARLFREGRLLSRALHRVPPRARLGIAVSLGLLLVVSLYFWLTAGTATLIIAGSHPFRSAQVSVWIDGSPQFKQEFNGSLRKRYGIFGNRVESFTRTLHISSGLHEIEVRVQSATDGYDEIRSYKGDFQADQKTRLYVSATHSQLSLSVQNQRVVESAEAKDSGSGFLTYLRSLFLTIGGSILSAGIGFLVQDFLKSRKLGNSTPKIPA